MGPAAWWGRCPCSTTSRGRRARRRPPTRRSGSCGATACTRSSTSIPRCCSSSSRTSVSGCARWTRSSSRRWQSLRPFRPPLHKWGGAGQAPPLLRLRLDVLVHVEEVVRVVGSLHLGQAVVVLPEVRRCAALVILSGEVDVSALLGERRGRVVVVAHPLDVRLVLIGIGPHAGD